MSSCHLAFQVVLVVKTLPTQAGDVKDMGLIPESGDPLEKEMALTPVFLPGKALKVTKESDMT